MVVQIDSEELQRARAHLKETLESKIEKLKKIEAEKEEIKEEEDEGQDGESIDSQDIADWEGPSHSSLFKKVPKHGQFYTN